MLHLSHPPPPLWIFFLKDVDEFSFQNKRTPLDDNSLQEQLENTIHAAMLRQKLSSSMGKPFKSHNPPSSHPKRSLSQSSFISDLTPTDDASLFDSTVYNNPDLIQYDSQELVADYDDRSEVMRELEQKTFPSIQLIHSIYNLL